MSEEKEAAKPGKSAKPKPQRTRRRR